MGASGPKRKAVRMFAGGTIYGGLSAVPKKETDPWAGSLTELSRPYSYECEYKNDLGTWCIAGFESLGIASHFGLTMQASETPDGPPREVALYVRHADCWFMPSPNCGGWIKHEKRRGGRKQA